MFTKKISDIVYLGWVAKIILKNEIIIIQIKGDVLLII